jgi:hypothetical protein
MKIDKAAKAAVIAVAIAASSMAAVTPASAQNNGRPKDCAGDSARVHLSTYLYRVTGLRGFFGFGFDAAMNRKFFSCQ